MGVSPAQDMKGNGMSEANRFTSSTAPGPSEMWRELLSRIYSLHGTGSLRAYQIANIASEVGFPVDAHPDHGYYLEEGYGENELNKRPNREKLMALSAFGTLLKKKHNHVHGDYRLICDRVELGWSKKTTRTTYHVELKDQPRSGKGIVRRFAELDVEGEE